MNVYTFNEITMGFEKLLTALNSLIFLREFEMLC